MTVVTPKHLWQCAKGIEQQEWIKKALAAGCILSDTGLWLGGVDHPQKVIASLRKKGECIETCTKELTDAAGDKFHDLAWRKPV